MSRDGSSKTMFDHVVSYQLELLHRRLPFPDVTHVDMFEEAVVFEKRPREASD